MAISFNNAYVIERDWMFDNGIIHVIDMVLLPPSDPSPMICPLKSTGHDSSVIVGSDGKWQQGSMQCRQLEYIVTFEHTWALLHSALYHTYLNTSNNASAFCSLNPKRDC